MIGHGGLCPRFHRAVELIGRRWSGAIIMLLMGREFARFNELLAAIPGVSDRLLTERLRQLEDEGIIERRVDGGRPVRVLYTLTPSGRALEPAITALGKWAEVWLDADRVVSASA